MALKTIVLVTDITNLSDARYCAGMGVEMLGFTLDAHLNTYIDPASFTAITQWVAGVKMVGVLKQADATTAAIILKNYALDYLLTEASPDWNELHALGTPLLCQVEIEEDVTLDWFQYHYQHIAPLVEYFVVVAHIDKLSEGTLQALTAIAAKHPVLLGFGVTGQNISSLISLSSFKGIALKGSHEIKPGFKDFDDLAAILEVLEEDE